MVEGISGCARPGWRRACGDRTGCRGVGYREVRLSNTAECKTGCLHVEMRVSEAVVHEREFGVVHRAVGTWTRIVANVTSSPPSVLLSQGSIKPPFQYIHTKKGRT